MATMGPTDKTGKNGRYATMSGVPLENHYAPADVPPGATPCCSPTAT